MGAIYGIFLLGTDWCYVGSAKNKDHRFRVHRRVLRLGKHHSPALQEAWNKYGENAFAFHVLEFCDNTLLIARERYWGTQFKNLFNFCAPGSKGGPKPEDFSERMKQSWVGREQTEAQRSQSNKVREVGLSNSPANKPGWIPEHRIGAKDTQETIEQRRTTKLKTEEEKRAQGLNSYWITNDIEEQLHPVGYLPPEGWRAGRSEAFVETTRINNLGQKRTISARQNMSARARSNWQDPAKREAMLSGRKPFKFITNGTIDKKLPIGDPLPEGFRFGRTNGLNPHGRAGKPA